MPNLPLTALGGPNATQNQTDIIFKKADFASVGLNRNEDTNTVTPKATNSATSLLVALLEYGSQNFTAEAQESDPSINMVIGKENTTSPVFTGSGNQEDVTYTVRVRRPRRTVTVDPDDFDT